VKIRKITGRVKKAITGIGASSSKNVLQMAGSGVCCNVSQTIHEGVLIRTWHDREENKLQRPNSEFIQHTPHEA